MRNTIFTGVGGPWTPPVWSTSPEELVKQAQIQLFDDRDRIEHGALMTDGDSMSGTVQAPANEIEKFVQADDPARSSRAAEWKKIVMNLHNTEPLPGQSASSSHQSDQQMQANTGGDS